MATHALPPSSLENRPISAEAGEDFIMKYRTYADVVEAPAEAHEMIAILAIASVLNKNGVYIQHGAIAVPMDLWLLILADSGGGKNTLVNMLRKPLEAAEIDGLIRTSTWGSPQALYQEMAENPTGLVVWPEMGAALKNLSSSHFAGVKEWITNLYDENSKPADVLYRKKGKEDTPPIVFHTAPRINILATSTPDWLMSNLAQEDTTGGFIPRWLPVKLVGSGKAVPIPKALDVTLASELTARLKKINLLRGSVELSDEVNRLYEEWYLATKKRFEEQPNPDLALPFFNRLRNQLLKLAVVYEVASTCSLDVSTAAMRKAIALVRRVEETIYDLLKTGMSSHGATLVRIEERIKAKKQHGISKSELTRAFQYLDSRERLHAIATLRNAGTVELFHKGTAGRTAELYVHRDYVALYKEEAGEEGKAA